MYKSLGLLRKGHCVEVTRADLVAGYVGQSVLKTQEVVKSALDGVLFIDEAYSLSRGSENDFGKEAVDFIAQAAVVYQHRLLIIAAGYPKEMEQFLSLNPGLASRFSEPIPFLDFSISELLEIMVKLVDKYGFILPGELHGFANQAIKSVMRRQAAAFGNARSVQQIFEEMKVNLARRVIALNGQKGDLTRDEMLTFQREDIPFIGFSEEPDLIEKEWRAERISDSPRSMQQVGQKEFEQPLSRFHQRDTRG